MKLISCHIENFGALHNYDLTFDGGLTSLYSPNGGGKSTLAAFIKAMFYGLPADSSRAKFNERRHYFPFNGGKFGGNITFEKEGSVYRIERFFDRTSGDDFKVYRDGSPCKAFADGQAGRALFGLDEDSFARTLYFNAGNQKLSSTGSINARLGDYIPEGEDDARTALDALDKACKKLQSRGGKGRIAELEGTIRRCRSDIANINAVSARLESKYAECSALNAKLNDLMRARADEAKRADKIRMWATYDDMSAAITNNRRRLAEIESKYPGGMPGDEEIAALNLAAGVEKAYRGKKLKSNTRMAWPTAASFLLSLLMIVAGCALINFNLLAGIAALAAGAMFSIATFCVLFLGKKGSRRKDQLDPRAAADAILKKYNLADKDYAQAAAQLSADLISWRAISQEISLAEGRANAFAQDNNLTARPVQGGDSGGEEEEELRRRLAAVDRDISDDESIVEGLGNVQSALAAAEEELASCKLKLQTYTAAAQFIREAERSLSAGFSAPVGRSFSRYSRILGNALGDSVYVDKNLSVALEGGGELRHDGHLSSGQRALVSLCYRLALTDHLFSDDGVFVILDDPFADLDEEHMTKAAQLLRELSGSRQIIYLYCHKSRQI